MTALGRRLVVLSAVALCDAGDQHEVRIISDGTDAYGYGITTGEDVAGVSRHHTTLRAACPVERHGRACEGTVEVSLEAEDWTSDAEAVRLLDAYGWAVER